jgi:hypothetical protein
MLSKVAAYLLMVMSSGEVIEADVGVKYTYKGSNNSG